MEGTSQLRCDEDIGPGHATRRLVEGIPNVLLVEVYGGAVEESIANGQGFVLRRLHELK